MAQTIEVQDVIVTFKGERVLEIENLRLEGPGLIQILGPNGAGKTTFLRVLAGLVKPLRGRVLVNGVDTTGRPGVAGRILGYVPQRPPMGRYSPISVFDLVCLGRSVRHGKLSRLRCRDGWILRLLEEVGLSGGIVWKRLWELSGGQVMRAFIARTLSHEPEIILMDEPLSPVDPAGKADLASRIGRLAESRLVIVTSHDPMILLPYTKAIMLLNRRLIAYGSPSEVLREDKLRLVYGGAAIPVRETHVHIADSHGR